MTSAGRSPSQPLDPGFAPVAAAWRRHQSALQRCAAAGVLAVALDRGDAVSRHEFGVLPIDHPRYREGAALLERCVKFLLWARGGSTLHLGCADDAGNRIAGDIGEAYAPDGSRDFDRRMMGRVYGDDFEVRIGPIEETPPAREAPVSIGGNLEGCRIGFDLGASDYKVAAVIDGETVFAEETPWDPKTATEPSYHLGHIRKALQRAAAHLPRVDAIGGSAASIYVDNRVRVASLFRAVPEDRFNAEVESMFVSLGKEWAVPLRVINDGDVTALSGAMASGGGAILGLALGSSEAAGYVDRDGSIPGWLNELGFAPLDLSGAAPIEEWSGDRGVGTSYLSQQAIERLSERAGIAFPGDLDLPGKLAALQEMAEGDDGRARRVFETVGAYLGHAVAWYQAFYDFEVVLTLGRVTSGEGGAVLVEEARRVLRDGYPEVAERVVLRLPDEAERRVGQAVAAASLPVLSG